MCTVGSVSLSIYTVTNSMNVPVPGIKLGIRNLGPSAQTWFLLSRSVSLLLWDRWRIYCEKEHAEGYILQYGEQNGILGETLQRAPFQVGDKGKPCWEECLSAEAQRMKSQPNQERKGRLGCIVCTVLPPVGHLRFEEELSFFILVFHNRNFIIII